MKLLKSVRETHKILYLSNTSKPIEYILHLLDTHFLSSYIL